MNTRISTLVVAIVVSGGILFSVGSPAVAKTAGFNKSSISITREAKLIRVIRVKLAKVKVKRVEKVEAIFESGRGNGNEPRAKRLAVEKRLIEAGRGNETRARVADPVKALADQPVRGSAQ